MKIPAFRFILSAFLIFLILVSGSLILGNFSHYEDIDVGRTLLNASSTLVEKGKSKARYRVDKAVDKLLHTSWCEGASGDGVGEYIELSFNPVDSLDIAVMNGFAFNPKYYYLNNRIKDYTLYYTLVDGTTNKISGTFPDNMCTEKNCSFQDFDPDFPGLIRINGRYIKIKLVINSVYKGKKYSDTCIAEIVFIKAHYSGEEER